MLDGEGEGECIFPALDGPWLGELLFQHTRDAMLVTTADTRIQYVNRAFTRLTGYSASEAIGQFPSLLRSGQHDPLFYQALWQTLTRDGLWQGQILDRRRDGAIFAADYTLVARRDAQGAISHYLGVFSEPEMSSAELLKSTHLLDSLTNLPDRAQLAARLGQALPLVRRDRSLLAVVSIDLDNFKLINALHGLVTGDWLLLQIARRLVEFVRPSELVARMGGDRFVVVLGELGDLNALEGMAQRLLRLVAEPITVQGREFKLTASLGMTLFPGDDSDAETLLSHADRAMFQAKLEGRNRYHLFDPRQDEQAHARRAWLDRFAAALHQDELVLHYQPKVNLRSGDLVGVEALLRWRHPERGLLIPADFLPQIEQDDLIIEVGVWVLRQALTQVEAWRKQGLETSVSVNIAARQLLREDFLVTLRGCLDAHPDVAAELIELEILETAALENTAHVRRVIEACRAWGVRFALDDFGIGYASLSYLRDIPAEVLKIDRSFVRDILEDRDDLTLVDGIIALATAFRREVVAEGVETAEQGVLLMRLGCDVGQGYGIARPMPANDLSAWAAQYQPDRQWALWADLAWDMEDFPLLVAQYDHVQWVERILCALAGSAPLQGEAELHDHHHCRFGHWYDHHGRVRYGHLQAYLELDPAHREVHRLGREIASLHAAGELTLALAKSARLVELKDEVLYHFASLQKSVADGPVCASHPPLGGGIRMQALRSEHLHAPGNHSVMRRDQVLILIVDDVPTNIELLADVLAADYAVKFATGGEKALALANLPDKPDLILLDVMMPEMDGYEVCRRLKENPQTRHIPVIFITAKRLPEEQERGFRAGAVDYIVKPFEASLVRARVRTHINLKLRTDLLEEQASLDGLTGIPNRRRFDGALAQEWRRALRNLMPLSLLMIDVDLFKDYNDFYGHGAGDECLRLIGIALINAQLRPGDFSARYGGEEFAVILPGCNSVGAQAIAERIRSYVEMLAIPHIHSPVYRFVTVSIGCATLKPSPGAEVSSLLLASDRALYEAKRAGRNRVCVGEDVVDGLE